MGQHETARQLLLENQLLEHITTALRTAVAWDHGPEFSNKLSTLRFLVQSLSRHLNRLMAMEEYEGYMASVVDACPHLADAIDELLKQHALFRATLDRLVSRFDRLATSDAAGLELNSQELLTFLEMVAEHHARERDILQEALLRDIGPGD